MSIAQGVSSHTGSIEAYRGRTDAEAVKAVTKEMEALFLYEMLKAMRNTVHSAGKNGMGNDTYMSLFDMELSRVIADRGVGLKDMLLKGLNRANEGRTAPDEIGNTHEVKDKPDSQGLKKDNEVDAGRILPDAKKQAELSEGLSLPVKGRITSQFGIRRHPVYGDSRFHHGIDIAAPEGASVYPIKEGLVVFSGEEIGYGNVVIIDHGDGLTGKYAHNRHNIVKAGEYVTADDIIALVGSTGSSTGPHLHFELRHNGLSVDPVRLIASANAKEITGNTDKNRNIS